ncbi:hypothetical protein F5141DRAFT_1065144 [Pisolithus sp. B1]|nr:hypothetical protein F5141DRAFT_1065144 [Pisolithus sp. B1]
MDDFGEALRFCLRWWFGLRYIYVYYMHYSEDALTLKSLVAATWILDTLRVAFDNQLWCADKFGVYSLVLISTLPQFSAGHYECSSLQASELINVLVIFVVQCLSPSSEAVGDCRNRIGMEAETVVLEYSNLFNHASVLAQIRVVSFYGVIPAVAIIALAEALITISLCVLLYDRRSSSAFPRRKCVLNTLIIYAVNRCLLIFCNLVEAFCGKLVAIAALATAVETQDIWFLGLSFVIGKSSLSSREHFHSQGAGTLSCPPTSAVLSANPPKPPGDVESSKDGPRQFDVPGVAVPDITIDPTPNKTTAQRREEEVANEGHSSHTCSKQSPLNGGLETTSQTQTAIGQSGAIFHANILNVFPKFLVPIPWVFGEHEDGWSYKPNDISQWLIDEKQESCDQSTVNVRFRSMPFERDACWPGDAVLKLDIIRHDDMYRRGLQFVSCQEPPGVIVEERENQKELKTPGLS